MSSYYSSTHACASKFVAKAFFATSEEAREFDRRWAAHKVADQDDATLGNALRNGDAELWAAMLFLVDEFPATATSREPRATE